MNRFIYRHDGILHMRVLHCAEQQNADDKMAIEPLVGLPD